MPQSPAHQQYLNSFASFLEHKKYSKSTVKNYLSDLRYFFRWTQQNKNKKKEGLPSLLTPPNLSLFQKSISSQKQGRKNLGRRLASLNLFCQFAQNQNLIHANPFLRVKKIKSQPNPTQIKPEKLLKEFATHLRQKKKSPSTVKNYLSDLRHFFAWNQKNTPVKTTNPN